MDAVKIEIDLDLCNKCKLCADVCFVDVIRWDADQERPVVAYPEDCVWCLSCEQACPAEAIEIAPTIPIRLPSPY